MGKTIIQTIGPLYGEVINGTVFGRPNGSIYVPSSNTITLNINCGYVKKQSADIPTWIVCFDDGAWGEISAVAESQDNANYIAIQVSQTTAFESLDAYNVYSAGMFNTGLTYIPPMYIEGVPTVPVDGKTYYVRAVLFSANGEPVAISEIKELVGLEE